MSLLVWRVLIALAANAVALALAAALLDGFDVDVVSFPLLVVAFSALELVLLPAVRGALRRWAEPVAAAGNLVGILLVLVVMDALFDGLAIDGVGTWIVATALIWVASLGALWFGRRRIGLDA